MTLTSDLGAAYAAQVKAVLVRSLGAHRCVELTHDLRAHEVPEAAFLLRAMARGFPSGTVHLAVVDPGVGGRRAPVAVGCRDGSRLVGPDNGVLTLLADELGVRSVARLDPARVGVGPRVGTTFDGRDLFAPAAVRLAGGARPGSLGPRARLTPLRFPVARSLVRGASGAIVHVDHFGNLVSNIPTRWVPRGLSSVTVAWERRTLRLPWTTSYEAIGDGRWGALGSSFGTVEIAVGRGRADRRLGRALGHPVRLRWRTDRRARLNR